MEFVEGRAPNPSALAPRGVGADSAVRANLHLLDGEGAPTAHLEAVRKCVKE